MPDEINPYAAPQVSTPAVRPGVKEFAPCPACKNIYAAPVGFTWWGGLVGPKLFTHVRCAACGTAYNGKTGKSNRTAITIYVAISLLTAAAVGLLMLLA